MKFSTRFVSTNILSKIAAEGMKLQVIADELKKMYDTFISDGVTVVNKKLTTQEFLEEYESKFKDKENYLFKMEFSEKKIASNNLKQILPALKSFYVLDKKDKENNIEEKFIVSNGEIILLKRWEQIKEGVKLDKNGLIQRYMNQEKNKKFNQNLLEKVLNEIITES